MKYIRIITVRLSHKEFFKIIATKNAVNSSIELSNNKFCFASSWCEPVINTFRVWAFFYLGFMNKAVCISILCNCVNRGKWRNIWIALSYTTRISSASPFCTLLGALEVWTALCPRIWFRYSACNICKAHSGISGNKESSSNSK